MADNHKDTVRRNLSWWVSTIGAVVSLLFVIWVILYWEIRPFTFEIMPPLSVMRFMFNAGWIGASLVSRTVQLFDRMGVLCVDGDGVAVANYDPSSPKMTMKEHIMGTKEDFIHRMGKEVIRTVRNEDFREALADGMAKAAATLYPDQTIPRIGNFKQAIKAQLGYDDNEKSL